MAQLFYRLPGAKRPGGIRHRAYRVRDSYHSHVSDEAVSVRPRLHVVARDPGRSHRLRGHQAVKRRGEKVYRVVHQRGFRLRDKQRDVTVS